VSQLRQFGLAGTLYAQDHADFMPPNLDGENIPLGETWVQGWLGMPGPDCTNTLFLKQSLLAPYVQNTALWKCPSAREVTLGRFTMPRVRTVSLNAFMGSSIQTPAAQTYRRFSDLVQLSPTEALTFLEERPETINDGAFSLQWDFKESQPSGWKVRDKPGHLHNRSGNLAFGDVETHRWGTLGVRDGLKTDDTCRFEIQLPRKLDGSSIRYRLVDCRRGSRVGLPGLEGSWPQLEERRNAGADFGRKRPHGRGKSADFSPATFCGFRNDADIWGLRQFPATISPPATTPMCSGCNATPPGGRRPSQVCEEQPQPLEPRSIGTKPRSNLQPTCS
jgi:hypothetical protein